MTINHAGGRSYSVDDTIRLTRLFCLGSEGGTYHVGEQDLTVQNAACVARMIEAGRGNEVVRMIVDFSVNGRASKQNGLMLAMAMCSRQEVDQETKRSCYENLHLVCRTPTQLFTFISYCEAVSTGHGWSRAHRRAIANWYFRFGQSPEEAKRLAVLVTKYKSRNGWSHRDVLRLAHPRPNPNLNDNGVVAILKYIQRGFDKSKEDLQTNEAILRYLQAVEDVKTQTDPNTLDVAALAQMIREHRLTREHVSTRLLNSPPIWEALLEHMPMTAMFRNLGKMSAIGMLTLGSDHERTIITRVGDIAALKNAKIHPFNVLLALLTYRRGQGREGNLTWSPNAAIMKALDDAFYLTFSLIKPTNKRYLLAIDVSPSMFRGSVIGCSSITPGTAAAALALVTARTERHCEIVAFSHGMIPIAVGAHMSLSDVEAEMRNVPEAQTADCSLPMQHALKNGLEVDVFVVYTDSENASPNISPAEALRQYRRQTGISDAKLVVCAMACNRFSVADPDDPNMLDMVGFDSNGTEAMRCFVVCGISAPVPPTTTPVASETSTVAHTEVEAHTAAGTEVAVIQAAVENETAETQTAAELLTTETETVEPERAAQAEAAAATQADAETHPTVTQTDAESQAEETQRVVEREESNERRERLQPEKQPAGKTQASSETVRWSQSWLI